MQLSNITNQDGLTERTEFWSGIPYGSSGDTLRTIITNINIAFDKILPMLLQNSDFVRWDDPNHTDAPIATTNIVANQNDYKFTEDDNSLDVLNVTGVRIFPNATETVIRNKLRRITLDDRRVEEILDPRTDVTGVPSGFLEVGNRIYLDILPDYASTNGLQIFFGREQGRFTVTGTSASVTTEPGIPMPFHELLALYAAEMYISVNRPDDRMTLAELRSAIKEMRQNLKNFIDARNPTKVKLEMRRIRHRLRIR